MNLTITDFCKKLQNIVYKAIDFDSLFSDISELQNNSSGDCPFVADNLSVLRDECLVMMCEDLVHIAVTEPHNEYVKFITSCIIYFLWSIDGSEPCGSTGYSFDYDFYVDLVTVRADDSNGLPESFTNSMLFKAALAACRIEDFYDLLVIATFYNDN